MKDHFYNRLLCNHCYTWQFIVVRSLPWQIVRPLRPLLCQIVIIRPLLWQVAVRRPLLWQRAVRRPLLWQRAVMRPLLWQIVVRSLTCWIAVIMVMRPMLTDYYKNNGNAMTEKPLWTGEATATCMPDYQCERAMIAVDWCYETPFSIVFSIV